MKNIYDVIINQPLLSDAFRFIILNNKSNLAPYHSFNHMMLVTQQIYNGFQESNEELPYFNLILAGMFHDMNHTMGLSDDKTNVKNAIVSLKDWWKNSGSKIDTSFMDIDIDECANIIRATQYPYVIDDKDLNNAQCLIRDCDLLIVLESNWFQNLLGLNKEMGVNDISLVLKESIKFYSNIEMRTKWAIGIYNNNWDEFTEKVNKYSELFNINNDVV